MSGGTEYKHDFKVIILPEVHEKIMYFVNKSPIEVSGLGRVEIASDGTMVVTKAYVVKQENTASTTDLDADAIAQLMYETREDAGSLTFWWHSHVNMGVFWSGTDVGTIKQFGKAGYLLSTVFNKRGEFRTSYYQGSNGFVPELFIDQIRTEIRSLPCKARVEEWEKEYTEKCKPAPVIPLGSSASSWKKGRKYQNGSRGWGYYDDVYGDEEWAQQTTKNTKSSTGAKSISEEMVEKAIGTSKSVSPVGIFTAYTLKELFESLHEIYLEYDPITAEVNGGYSRMDVEKMNVILDSYILSNALSSPVSIYCISDIDIEEWMLDNLCDYHSYNSLKNDMKMNADFFEKNREILAEGYNRYLDNIQQDSNVDTATTKEIK